MGDFATPKYKYPTLGDYFVLDSLTAPAQKSNTFYVIARPGITMPKQYRNSRDFPVGPWKPSLKDAQRFTTFNDAAQEFVVALNKSNIGATLVRVTEVPGTTKETRRMLGETEPAKEHETVKYALYGTIARGLLRSAREGDWQVDKVDPATALLFNSQRAAIEHAVERKDISVETRRIAISTTTTPSTFTEEVVK